MIIDHKAFITSLHYFTWGEALYLPSYDTYHIPTDEEIANIIELAGRLDRARVLLSVPFKINCWIRPTSVNCSNPKFQGKNYNLLVGGAKNSSHINGCAVDFIAVGLSVDEAQNILKPMLPSYKIAMELNGKVVKRNWLHAQSRPLPSSVTPYRFFLP